MSIVFRHVGFEWPNGQIVFENLNFSLSQKVYGLVGPNGVGKTTLANLIAKELMPTSGSLVHTQEIICFFKQIEERPEVTIAEYLLDILSSHHPFVASILEELSYDRVCSSLSGGEWTRVRLAKVAGLEPTFLILDEPTNHLDQEGRTAVHAFLKQFTGGVLIISHDRDLLEKSQDMIELSSKGISIFGGSWEDYELQRQQERERLLIELEQAKKNREDTIEERHQKKEQQAKRQRQGKLNGLKGGMPKILIGARKRAAQVTQGKIDQATMVEVENAVSDAWEAYQSLKIDPVMYARLPKIHLPNGKVVIEAENFNFRFQGTEKNLWQQNLNFSFRGPVRLSIQGANGSGKSTLLRLLQQTSVRGDLMGLLKLGTVQPAFLDQEYSLLQPQQSILTNVRETANLEESELWSLLAMFLFKGEFVNRKVSELSGGERLRAALAKAFLSHPPANVLFLDEPTNNLDIPNIEFLEELLKQYKGALVVISHDKKFLERINMTEELVLQ